MSAELEPIAQEQLPILRNLLELYVHDFSEWVPRELGPNGRFDLDPGTKWWTEEDHYPFFIRSNGHLSGFALVRRGSRIDGSREVMDVAELFVVRGARARGVGTSIVHALLARYPGTWEFRVRMSNPPALRFWSRIAGVGEPLSVDGVDWQLFRCSSPR